MVQMCRITAAGAGQTSPIKPQPACGAWEAATLARCAQAPHLKGEKRREPPEAVGLVAGVSRSEMPGDRLTLMGWLDSARSAVTFPATWTHQFRFHAPNWPHVLMTSFPGTRPAALHMAALS